MWWCRCRVTFLLRFSDPETQLFSNSPPHCALGRYRRPLPGRFVTLEILNYCPDGGNGNFHRSSPFLKAPSQICEAQLSFAAHQKYILWFFSLWWMITWIWAFFPLLFIFLWNRKPWLDNYIFIITTSKLWIPIGRYFTQEFFRGANSCPTCIWEKHLFHNDIFPRFKFLLSNERLYFCELLKISKGLKMQIRFHSLLWSYTKDADIFGHDCINIWTVNVRVFMRDFLKHTLNNENKV